jgi:hypothetical protein
MQVNKNLFSALQRLRKEDKQRVLWVDAICINQMDFPERAHQVQRMRLIYQRATRVLIWLGEGDQNSDLAMNVLERLGGTKKEVSGFTLEMSDWQGPQFEPSDGLNSQYGFPNNRRNDELEKYLNSLNLMDPADLVETEWAALDEFFNKHPWWTRVWVIQEVANAQSAKIYCGTKSMDWESLNNVIMSKKYQKSTSKKRFLACIHRGGAALLMI